MGIKDLSKVIADYAPRAMKENEIKAYFGRKIAIDASMSIYQFLIAIRGQNGVVLSDEAGAATSHILGMFYRTVRLIVNDIKPVYVFDGKPPTLKSGELARRKKRAAEAKEELEEAKEIGEKEDAEKLAKRTIRVGKEENDDVKRLLQLMGVPVVEAPCEAEAQCAAMVKAGLVWATGTEDMDALTLGTPTLLRHLNFSEARQMPICEYKLENVLKEMEFTMDMFIDLCILLGCDYCDTVKGIGPKRAMELIKKYKSIEEIRKHLDEKKHPFPERFPLDDVRELFKNPVVTDPSTIELKWSEPDVEGLKKFLIEEKGFNEQRVSGAIERLVKATQKSNEKGVQGRIDTFFTRSSEKTDFVKPGAKRKQLTPKKEISFSRSKRGKR